MAYEQIQKAAQRAHSLSMENREKLSLGGVEDVSGFDENLIVLTTSQGQLAIRGEGLHIEKLSLDGGDLKVDGLVNALIYEPRGRERGGLLSRLLGG